MKTNALIRLIELETADLIECANEFDRRSRGMDYKPFVGSGYVHDKDPGMQARETSYALERKIVTIREHLNMLRKQTVFYRKEYSK